MPFESLDDLEKRLKAELVQLKATNRYHQTYHRSLVAKGARRIFTSDAVLKALHDGRDGEAVNGGRVTTADYLDGHGPRTFWHGTLVEVDAEMTGLTFRLERPR